MIEGLGRRWRGALAGGHVRHYGGFVLGGVSALATDMAVLALLTRVVGLNAFIARPFGIGTAMVVSWLINRTITFRATVPASLLEFSKFAGVSATAQAINYLVYAVLLLLVPALIPELAVVLACLVSMLVSYAGYRFGVFRSGVPGAREGRP